MMIRKAACILFIAVIFSSCKSNEANLRRGEFTLKVSTTPCFGACPIYDLTIKESGLAVYNGKNFPKTGEIFTNLPKWEIDSLRDVLADNNFFELDSVYDNPGVTDLPSMSINLVLENGTEKEVRGRYDQPQELRNITAFIERLRKRNF